MHRQESGLCLTNHCLTNHNLKRHGLIKGGSVVLVGSSDSERLLNACGGSKQRAVDVLVTLWELHSFSDARLERMWDEDDQP